jgi:hypothetical protein
MFLSKRVVDFKTGVLLFIDRTSPPVKSFSVTKLYIIIKVSMARYRIMYWKHIPNHLLWKVMDEP